MKTIIMFSAILLFAATPLLDVLNIFPAKPQQLSANECQLNPYACFRPNVSFSSLR
ncbi:hypothetical protein D3C87_1241040 [compost metagenome]